MKLCVFIETRAVRDLDEASGWVAERSPEAAERWLNAIEAEIYSLAHFPERCPLARENGQFPYELRQLVYGKRHGPYRIIFTVRNAAVHVLHVRHGAKLAMTKNEIEGLVPPKA
jgi:plasmid stabilization system protein ParE